MLECKPSPVPGWISDADITFLQGLVCDLRDATVVEVGVALGRVTGAIAGGLSQRGCRYVCIDTFAGGTDQTDSINALFWSGRGRFVRLGFEYNMRALGVWNNLELIETPSPEAANIFADQTVDFCFLDADHSLPAIEADIAAWWPKIEPGGCLAGDDYHGKGVRAAVDAFVNRTNLSIARGFRCWAAEKPKEGH